MAIFSEESLREMNYKAGLIKKIQRIKFTDPGKYLSLVKKYNIENERFNWLGIKELKEIVDEYNTQ